MYQLHPKIVFSFKFRGLAVTYNAVSYNVG